MNFTIDPEFLTDQSVTRRWSLLSNPDNPTPEDLIKLLTNKHEAVSYSHQDHPEFTKLREQLGELGFISIQRISWNGDCVLKPFTLNGYEFKVGTTFWCAVAMQNMIRR